MVKPLPLNELKKRLVEAGLGPEDNGSSGRGSADQAARVERKARGQPGRAPLSQLVSKAIFDHQAIWADVRASEEGVTEVLVVGGDLTRIRRALEQIMPSDRLWNVRRLDRKQLRRFNWLLRLARLSAIFQESVKTRMEQFGGHFRGSI